MKYFRLLVLGLVALGVVLALTIAPSSSALRGQTGYGNDVASNKLLEVNPAEQAGASSDDDSGSGFPVGVVVGAGVAALLLGGAAFMGLRRRYNDA